MFAGLDSRLMGVRHLKRATTGRNAARTSAAQALDAPPRALAPPERYR